MLLKRILSSLVGVPVILFSVWQGGLLHFILALGIMIIAIIELNKIFYFMKIQGSILHMIIGILILSIGSYAGGIQLLGLLYPLVILIILFLGVFLYPKIKPGNIAGAILGISYVSLFIFFYLTGTLENGQKWVLIMLVGTWAADITAFIVGKNFGRKKLAPQLSPGKTVEGALSGLAGSIVAVMIFNYFINVTSLPIILILGFLIGVLGVVGDLFESSLKRAAGIKDAGGIIPGHGGVLDRFDSLFFIAPMMYGFIVILI